MNKLTTTELKTLTDEKISSALAAARHNINVAADCSGMSRFNAAIKRYNQIAAEARRRGWDCEDK
jgi:hypothetical protein